MNAQTALDEAGRFFRLTDGLASITRLNSVYVARRIATGLTRPSPWSVKPELVTEDHHVGPQREFPYYRLFGHTCVKLVWINRNEAPTSE